MAIPMPVRAPIDDDLIGELLDRAAVRLAELADSACVLVPERVPPATAIAGATSTGWCEIGRLREARGRFWYRVLWHPESGSGRLLRERPKPPRGALGEPLGLRTNRKP